MPDGSTTALDFCQAWTFDASYEYEPDEPPEVLSFELTLNASTDDAFECRVEVHQEAVCGIGYYDERASTTSTRAVLLGCSGVGDDYELSLIHI